MYITCKQNKRVNILKINCLQGQLNIDETQKINLRGIHKELIQTIGKIKIPVIINNKNIDTEFYVVGMQFPIPKDGILGHEFLLKNKVMVDVAKNRLIIQDDEATLHKEHCSSVIFKLQPRTETVVEIAIADPVVESKSMYIHKQQITKDVYCSSTVSTVNKRKAIVSMLNISEEIKDIDVPKLSTTEHFHDTQPLILFVT
ncbi:hypothetical protein AGLY_007354, partial [Aphis glycines]